MIVIAPAACQNVGIAGFGRTTLSRIDRCIDELPLRILLLWIQNIMTNRAHRLIVVCVLAAACANVSAAEPQVGKWVSLFNGQNLDGWIPKLRYSDLGENYGDTFRVEDGLLTVSYDKYDKFGERFGHLFYKDSFSNYRLRIEYRFIGEQCPEGPGWAFRNSGVMLHCQDPKSMKKDQDFPVSIETQMLGGNGKDNRSTANLCTPGTNVVMDGKLILRHCTSSKSKTYHGDQWVTLEVVVNGDRTIEHLVNGESVMKYEAPQLDERDENAKALIKDGNKLLKSGYFSLQAESHPVQFRKVEIMLLPEE